MSWVWKLFTVSEEDTTLSQKETLSCMTLKDAETVDILKHFFCPLWGWFISLSFVFVWSVCWLLIWLWQCVVLWGVWCSPLSPSLSFGFGHVAKCLAGLCFGRWLSCFCMQVFGWVSPWFVIFFVWDYCAVFLLFCCSLTAYIVSLNLFVCDFCSILCNRTALYKEKQSEKIGPMPNWLADPCSRLSLFFSQDLKLLTSLSLENFRYLDKIILLTWEINICYFAVMS